MNVEIKMETNFTTPDETERAFYKAFQQLDLDAMRRVWTGQNTAVCIHPGGPLITGSQAVLESWAEIFQSASPPEIRFRILSRTLSADLAVHVVEEHVRPSRASTSEVSLVLATNIYQRNGTAWRLIEHHASLPVMGSAKKRRKGQLH